MHFTELQQVWDRSPCWNATQELISCVSWGPAVAKLTSLMPNAALHVGARGSVSPLKVSWGSSLATSSTEMAARPSGWASQQTTPISCSLKLQSNGLTCETAKQAELLHQRLFLRGNMSHYRLKYRHAELDPWQQGLQGSPVQKNVLSIPSNFTLHKCTWGCVHAPLWDSHVSILGEINHNCMNQEYALHFYMRHKEASFIFCDLFSTLFTYNWYCQIITRCSVNSQ